MNKRSKDGMGEVVMKGLNSLEDMVGKTVEKVVDLTYNDRKDGDHFSEIVIVFDDNSYISLEGGTYYDGYQHGRECLQVSCLDFYDLFTAGLITKKEYNEYDRKEKEERARQEAKDKAEEIEAEKRNIVAQMAYVKSRAKQLGIDV